MTALAQKAVTDLGLPGSLVRDLKEIGEGLLVICARGLEALERGDIASARSEFERLSLSKREIDKLLPMVAAPCLPED